MKKVEASWSISCFVDCPGCDNQIDLMDERDSGLDPECRPWPGIDPRQADLGIELRCKKCGSEFIVDSIEY